MIANVRTSAPAPPVQPRRVWWNPLSFWRTRQTGSAGAVHPRASRPGQVSMLPHSVTSYQRPAFANPTQHYQRTEFLVEPPNLPGTAIANTLFHPVYAPGLQGYMDWLPFNYAWNWARHSFTEFASKAFMDKVEPAVGSSATILGRPNAWKPVAKVPQGAGQGIAWQQRRPDYTPRIANPGVR